MPPRPPSLPSSRASAPPIRAVTLPRAQVLLIDSPEAAIQPLAGSLSTLLADGDVHLASNLSSALSILAVLPIDVVVCDAEADQAGLSREILVRYPWVVRLMLVPPSQLPELPGATGWSERLLPSPCPPERLLAEMHSALTRRDQERRRRLGVTNDSSDPVVLMVEDSPEELELLRQALLQTGCTLECWSVADGRQALEFLDRQDRFSGAPAPHVILLDLNLPRMNGYEFLSRYRSRDGAKVPVVVLSGSAKPNESAEAIRHGAAANVPKPATWGPLPSNWPSTSIASRASARSPVRHRQARSAPPPPDLRLGRAHRPRCGCSQGSPVGGSRSAQRRRADQTAAASRPARGSRCAASSSASSSASSTRKRSGAPYGIQRDVGRPGSARPLPSALAHREPSCAIRSRSRGSRPDTTSSTMWLCTPFGAPCEDQEICWGETGRTNAYSYQDTTSD